MIIRSKAPVRISFGGGGTDTPPYCDEYGGSVVNATINCYSWATLKTRDDHKIVLHSENLNTTLEFDSIEEMEYDGNLDLIKAVLKNVPVNIKRGFEIFLLSDVPPKSGLGGSASAFVAIIGLLNHLLAEKKLTNYEIAELAHHLEREELKIKGGRQDQYATVFGGINFIEFKGQDFVRVNPLKLPRDSLLELEKHLILVNVGDRKDQGHDVILDQTKNLIEHKNNVLENMHKTKQLSLEIKYALLRADFIYFGKLLHESWLAKKQFSSMISNSYIDELYETARKAGAIGGKVTGAGGGGHMIFFCKPNTEHIVEKVLKEKGAIVVPFSFDLEGLQTWEVHNQ